MPIDIKDIVVGGVYRTPTGQLRRVREIIADKVTWESKSENFPDRPWEPGHTKERPSQLSKFAEDCSDIVFKPKP